MKKSLFKDLIFKNLLLTFVSNGVGQLAVTTGNKPNHNARLCKWAFCRPLEACKQAPDR